MADSDNDLLARKQLLLTRISLQRVQLTSDTAELRDAASLRQIMARGVRAILPTGLANSVLQPSTPSRRAAAAGVAQRVMQAVVFARRYPLLVSIAGGMLARRSIRRVIYAGVVVTVGAGIWVTVKRRDRASRQPVAGPPPAGH